MSLAESLKSLLHDPPPEFAFEITAEGIAMSRTRPPASVQYASLPANTVAPSPVKDNILDAVAFAAVVQKLVPKASGRTRRGCALILPDNSVRVAVLDFDTLPAKEEEVSLASRVSIHCFDPSASPFGSSSKNGCLWCTL